MNAPVYRAVMKRDLTLGVPREAFLYFIVACVIIIISLQQTWFIAVAIVLFFILRIITKVDEYAFEIMLRHVAQPNRIEA